jgi:hypothetical protein
MVTLTGQPFQPKPVGEQQMVQCAAQAAEEDADVKPMCLIRQVECGGRQARVCSAIIGGKLSKLVDGHGHLRPLIR